MASDSRRWTEANPRRVRSTDVVAGRALAVLYGLWNVLVYSSVYIAIIAALEALLVIVVLDVSLTPAPVVVGCVTFTIYANDRVLDVEQDMASNPGRTMFVARHRRTLSGLAALSYGLALAVATWYGPLALGFVLLPAIAWVMYAVSWVPTDRLPFQRCKDLLVVNSAIVGLAWGLTIVGVPVLFAGGDLTTAVWLLVAYFAVGTFIGTEISNVRDVQSDVESGVETLPTAVGIDRTKLALHGLALAGLGVLGYGWAVGSLSTVEGLALGASLVGTMGIVSQLDRTGATKALAIAGECVRPCSLGLVAVLGLVA